MEMTTRDYQRVKITPGVVANIRTRYSKTQVEKGFVPTAVDHRSVGSKKRPEA